MTRNQYWKYPDQKQSQLDKYTSIEFMRLQNRIQALLDRFKKLDGIMSFRELYRFKDDIRNIEKLSLMPSKEFDLMLRDIKRRKLIRRADAIYFLLMFEYINAYSNIRKKSIELNTEIYRQKYEEFTGSESEDTIDDMILLYTSVLPIGVSPDNMICTEAIFRTDQMFKAIRAQRGADENFNNSNSPAIEIALARAKNALIVKSQAIGYHGILDVIMTSVIGYAIINAAYKLNARKYTFMAVLDERTTDICRHLDSEIMNVSDMRLGWNVPPISWDYRTNEPIPHPCRSWIVLKVKEKDKV